MRQWTPDLVIHRFVDAEQWVGWSCAAESVASPASPSLCFRSAARKRPRSRLWNSGADDYVTKPFNMNELVARVRAGLRRASLPIQEEDANQIEAGDFVSIC